MAIPVQAGPKPASCCGAGKLLNKLGPNKVPVLIGLAVLALVLLVGGIFAVMGIARAMRSTPPSTGETELVEKRSDEDPLILEDDVLAKEPPDTKPKETLPDTKPKEPPPPPTKREAPAAGSTRAKLLKKPELVKELDMDKFFKQGDRMGDPIEAALSPDNKYLAVGGKFTVIRFFEYESGKFITGRPDPRPKSGMGSQRTLVWVPDKQDKDHYYCVAIGSEHSAYVWDSKKEFNCVKAFRHTIFESSDIAWNPKKRRIAVAQYSGIVSVWDFDRPATGGEKGVMGFGDRTIAPETMAHGIFVPKSGEHARAVQGVAWAPEGERIAAISSMGLDILDSSGKGPVMKPGDTEIIHKQFWTPKATKEAAIRDMPLIKRVPIPASDSSGIPFGYRVDWSPDGKLIAAGYGVDKDMSHKKANANLPARIRIFDGQSYKQLREWAGHKIRVYALKFSPDGTVLAGGGGTEVFLWDPNTGEKLMSFPAHGDEVTCARWSDDGKLLITCAGSERHDSPTDRNNKHGEFNFPGNDRKVRIWKVAE